MNRVVYEGYTFSDATGTLYQGASSATYFSPLGDDLRAAEYKIPVIFTPRLYDVEAKDFKAGAAIGQLVALYQDDAWITAFYLTAISGGQKLPGGRYLFTLEGTDFAGLLVGRTHRGGIYSASDNKVVGDVLRELMGASFMTLRDPNNKVCLIIGAQSRLYASLYVSYGVYDTPLRGWLPYTDDARLTLRYLMQLTGARLSWWTGHALFANATLPIITDNFSAVPDVISPYDTYAGGGYVDEATASDIIVNEHAYLALDNPTETLYETGDAVTAHLVRFDRPMHSLVWSGTSIDSRGANFAVVTGTGTLTGKPYTVTTRIVSKALNTQGEARVMDNPLVNALNSTAMLERMENYYTTRQTLETDFVASDNISAGSYVQIEDPLGELRRAYIAEQVTTYSGINKAVTQLAAGWYPITGSLYTQRKILTEDGTLEVPDGATLMRLIAIQGGRGGWGGYQGGAGEAGRWSGLGPDATFIPGTTAGEGGNPGEGGDPGLVLQIEVPQADLESSYAVSIGQGGAAGGINHGQGTEGTHSTVTGTNHSYTSADGAMPATGVQDAFTGETYASHGKTGVYAGVHGIDDARPSYATLTDAATGVTGNTTWRSGNVPDSARPNRTGGGGPAYGSDGAASSRRTPGKGADAVLDGFNGYTAPEPDGYGTGGIGGNGGGGGGQGGQTTVSAAGGNGSPGGPGAPGAVIAYFAFGGAPEPAPEPDWLLDDNNEPLYDFDFERLAAQEG